MIDRNQAEHRERQKLVEYGQHGVECALLDEHTREESFGWVFFYQSMAYCKTGKLSDMLAGNAPLVVFRDTDEVRPTGTARPFDEYLAALRIELSGRQG